MDIKEYIETGIVELYVMDVLSPKEKEEFERMLILYPELKAELQAVEEALFNHAEENAIQPPSYLKNQIINKINVAPVKTKEKSSAIVLNLWTRIGIAAVITIAFISVSTSVYFYTKWKLAAEQIALYENEKTKVADILMQVNQQYSDTKSTLEVLRDINTKTILLSSVKPGEQFSARVYWNEKSHQSLIDVTQLPPPGPSQQYQLWALVDGKPVDAGVFSVDSAASVQRVKNIERADAWAVTLEPAGGSQTPHLDQMYLLSKS